MPSVKLKHIVSFSSEDKIHKAENLLLSNTSNKWRCGAPGEKQAFVVVQLEKATKIHSVDIGNDGSAFVEILVTRSTGDEIYKVLLPAASFMSLAESRNGTGTNRVRIFDSDKLAKDVRNEKWDRIKIVCTQPFNKHATYGLHFINLHYPEETSSDFSEVIVKSAKAEDASGEPRQTFGAFKLKVESENKTPLVQSPIAKLPIAGRSIDIEKLKRKNAESSLKPVPEKKSKLVPTDNNNRKSINVSSHVVSSKEKSSSVNNQKPTSSKTAEASVPRQVKKFEKILDGVVFALSGYQNPERGDIRDKGLMMGAQYRRDWTSDCTHLVCAFANTPKYHQVLGTEGKIVRSDWIVNCFNKKKKLPLKEYNLRPDFTSSDEEQEQESNQSVNDPYDDSTDEESIDTDDEIERVMKKRPDVLPQAGDKDPYDESTDEEAEDPDSGVITLPDYFSGKHFFLFGDFRDEVERFLKRHIIACNGLHE